ncbi:MAG TPA: DUF2975 domain-containing protein [Sphingomicrobium sp.]|jgi:hypothetical protein|nr:DUF2975 domain-containing protein [Sphingomicrobium sp.]
MSHQTSALPIAYVFLRILAIINLLSGAAIFVLLVATIVAQDWTFRALGITPDSGIPQMIMGLRAIAVLGIVSVLLNNGLLKRLLAIVETVKLGDPFVAANAFRLHTIAWLLLGLQILSLAIAEIGHQISTRANPVHLDAGFSPMGWLAVLMTFVLARVFAEGTLMREDLEGTV